MMSAKGRGLLRTFAVMLFALALVIGGVPAMADEDGGAEGPADADATEAPEEGEPAPLGVAVGEAEPLTVGSYGVNLASAGYQTNVNPFFGLRGRSSDGGGGQCTWYAWGRAYEKLGVSLGSWGHAKDWTSGAAASGWRFGTGMTARANSIMVENDGSTYGHVYFVERVEGGYAYVSEGNWDIDQDGYGFYHEDRINLSTKVRDHWPGHTLGTLTYIYLEGDGYVDLGDDFYANIAATGFGEWSLIENGAGNVQVASRGNDHTDVRQQWHFVRQSDGSYIITSVADGRYLNADRMAGAGTNISCAQEMGWDGQRWYVVRNGSWYSLLAKYDTGLCLDVYNANISGGTNIQLWSRNDSGAQLFDIYKYDPTTVKRDISQATISAVADQTWTGSAITPSPTVKWNGATLTRGTDYTLSYSDNVNVGTATVTVTGRGNYTGSRTVSFRVSKPAAEPSAPQVQLIPIYRMYNTKTSEHLWTKSKKEYDSCGKGSYGDWRQEGVAWYSPGLKAPRDIFSGTQGDYVYVWRLYDKGRTGDHIYLVAGSEMNDYLSDGWVVDKGAGFWTLRKGAKVSGKTTIPIYRAYNPKLKRGKHHYTPSKFEYDTITKKNGWKAEGTRFYVVKR